MSRLWRFVSRYGLLSQLPRNRQLTAHVGALRTVHKGADKDLFDHLYTSLSILDSKSQSLLGFNSIIAAVFAIFMQGDLGEYRRLAATGMALTLASCLFLLLVVWVHWSTPEEMKDHTTLPATLLSVRRERTIEYRLGWYLSVGAVLVLACLVVQLVARSSRPAPSGQSSPETRSEPRLSAPPR